jgi:hypothetical protein
MSKSSTILGGLGGFNQPLANEPVYDEHGLLDGFSFSLDEVDI